MKMLLNKLVSRCGPLVPRTAVVPRRSCSAHVVAVPPRNKVSSGELAVMGLILATSLWITPFWVLYHVPDYQKEDRNQYTAGCLVLGLLAMGFLRAEEADFPREEFHNEFARASCDFTLDVLKASSKDTEDNVLFSPSSISVLLAILQQGAKENTAAQLEKVLHLSVENSRVGYGHVMESLRREKANLTLEWGNRVFVIPGFELEDDFLRTVEDNFNATFEELDFKSSSPAEAANKINEWVKEATHDNIQDMLDASLLTSDVVMVMVNAIYFYSVWDSPFQKYKTRHDKFQTSSDLKVEVPFMRQEGRFTAGEDAEVGMKWVELPFKDENFSMVFILPIKANGLSQVIENLSGAALRHVIGNKGTRQVKLTIPKFKLTKKISLANTLKELGLTDVFTGEANLKGISGSEEGLRLSHFIHQANVEIDEDGSTAAAASLDIVQTLSFEWFTDELYFRADHPFLFFIVDKLNEVPIFAGKIVNPKSSGDK